MKCTIFGGGGFIGSTIADRLLKEGCALKIFERLGVKPYRQFRAEEKVEWINGDFSDTADVSKAIQDTDVVIHLVSNTLPKSSKDDPIYDVTSNVVSTLQMLNSMVKHNVSRIIFISSGGTVYGNPKYLPIDEIHPTDPMVSYGITKLMIEKYLMVYELNYGIRPIILRVANPYGERQRVESAQGAIGVFLHKALSDTPIEIWGDGSTSRDYIHISDVAEAFWDAINYSGDERIFNVSSGVGTTLNELVKLINEITGKDVNCKYYPARDFDVPVSILSNNLACAEMAWKPKVDLRIGIKRTAEWMGMMLPK